jgi:hypothetical protein
MASLSPSRQRVLQSVGVDPRSVPADQDSPAIPEIKPPISSDKDVKKALDDAQKDAERVLRELEARTSAALEKITNAEIDPLLSIKRDEYSAKLESAAREHPVDARRLSDNAEKASEFLRSCLDVAEQHRQVARAFVEFRSRVLEFYFMDRIQEKIDSTDHESTPWKILQREAQELTAAMESHERHIDAEYEDKNTGAGGLWAARIQKGEAESRQASLKANANFLYQELAYKRERVQVSRELAWKHLAAHMPDNGPLNHLSQLTDLQRSFSLASRILMSLVYHLRTGFKEVYGSDPPPDPTGALIGIEDIALWLVAVRQRLFQKQRLEVVMPVSIWSAPDSGGRVAFNATTEILRTTFGLIDGWKGSLRLRGLSMEYIGVSGRPPSYRLTPPAKVVSSMFSNLKAVHFDRLTTPDRAVEPRPQFSEVFWNAPSSGVWTAERIIRGDNEPSITQVGLIFWLAMSQ